MAGRYQTSPEEMGRAAARVRQVDEEVRGELGRLRVELTPLTGGWRGEAATAFHGLMERWNEDARRLSDALRGIGTALEASGRGYQQAEEAQRQGMTSITSALG